MLRSLLVFTLGLIGLIACGNAEKSQSQPRPQQAAKTEKKEQPQPIQTSVQETTKDTIPLEWVMGKLEYSKNENFVKIDKKYCDRAGLYLHKETLEAYIKMYEAAQKDGINLVVRSAARNFKYQKGIWERKFTGQTAVDGKNLATTIADPAMRAKKILEYSSMPGTSRHHWGTDIDLNAFNNEHFKKGEGLKVYDWLVANGPSFGFCQVYSPIGEARPTGYFEERWHWSYLPVAHKYMATAKKHLKASDIKGFKGSEAAVPLDVVNNFVLGINPDCFEK